MQDIRDFIVDYIEREYSIPEDADINTFNFMETGYVDSIGVIQFVAEIEERFNVEFSDEELNNPDFKIVGTLTNMIANKRGE